MGADAGGVTWPDALVDRLAARHRVVRYDHRDTGRSTRTPGMGHALPSAIVPTLAEAILAHTAAVDARA